MEKVYVLRNPDTWDIFYVGRTKRELAIRLYNHITDRADTPKCQFVRQLLSVQKVPIIELVEELETNSQPYAIQREAFWINYYTVKGCSLLNQTVGGSREGAGAKQKYGEPTKLVPLRIPESKIKEFKKLIAPILKKWEVKKPKS
jgi:hypothetical protein